MQLVSEMANDGRTWPGGPPRPGRGRFARAYPFADTRDRLLPRGGFTDVGLHEFRPGSFIRIGGTKKT
jgi:hypothetical protein